MSNVLMIPASGAIIFDSQSPNSSIISPLSAAPRLSYDNAGGLNITSYTTGVSTFDRFTVDGSYGRLFGVSDSVTGVVFSVNDAAGLPIVEVESNFTDKITMGTYGTNALVVNDNKIGIGNPAPTAKLDIAETWNSNITVTGASGTGSIATITFAAQSAAIVVGSTIAVASINPSGYNGTFVVTASTTTSVSYANATTAAWVSGGTIQQLFTAVKLNVTDTASNAGSKLFDLQVGGVSRLSVRKDGYIYGNGGYNAAVFNAIQVANLFFVNPYTGNIGLSASTRLMWGNSNAPTNNDGDLMLYRDASAILAQRNVGTAQTFRVYNATDLSDGNPVNFDRATFGWTSNVLRIGTEMGGTYTTARGIDFITNGAVRMSIAATGLVTIDSVAISRGAGTNGSSVAIGAGVLPSNSTGASNTAVGLSVLYTNTTGSLNSGLGVNALIFNTTGSNNSGFGVSSLFSNTSGSSNTAVGHIALFANTTGSFNSAIGAAAGQFIADGTTANATGANSLFLGAGTKALAAGQTNQIVIGYDAIGLGSNSAVLGNSSITTTALRGNVGIGTTTPSVQLDVLSTLIANCANFTIKNNNTSWTGTRFGWSQGDGSLPYGLTIGGFNTSGNKLIKFIPDNSPSGVIFSGVDDLYSFEARLVAEKGITGNYHSDLDIVLRQHTNGGSDKGIKFKLNGGSSTAMSIMETGKVGIGTTNPVADLDIVDTWNAPAITVTGASGTGTTATITFATQAIAIQVGSTIVVASINPAGYNGTFVVTASSLTSVSYANVTTTAWVSGGTVQQLFTAVKLNVTDTASNAGSNLMDLQVGGVSKLSVTKTGQLVLPISNNSLRINTGLFFGTDTQQFYLQNAAGTPIFALIGNSGGPTLGSTMRLGWTNSTNAAGLADTFLVRDDAGIVAQRNVGTAQTFRIYNTYTNAGVDYERISMGWSAGTFTIGREWSGTGIARPINITGGSSVVGFGSLANAAVDWTFSAGHLLTGTDNTKDIGASGANRPRAGYFGTNLNIGGRSLSTATATLDGMTAERLALDGHLSIASGRFRTSFVGNSYRFVATCQNVAGQTAALLFGVDSLQYDKGLVYDRDTGNISLVNGSSLNSDTYAKVLTINTSGLLMLHGTTSSFPAIKRNGTGIDIKLADDSLFTNLSCKNVIQSPGIGTTVTPASNGDLVFETTSNTSVTLKLRGSDGVVRSASLTLA